MLPLHDDIVAFIHDGYCHADAQAAVATLDRHHLSSWPVVRAVLCLAAGNLALLRHYAEAASLDARPVIADCEFAFSIAAAEPPALPERCPVPDRAKLTSATPLPEGSGSAGVEYGQGAKPSADAGPGPAAPAQRHRQLVGRSFSLGNWRYTVSSRQTADSRVRCHRRRGQLTTIMHLPLCFVLEQLSERIELSDVG